MKINLISFAFLVLAFIAIQGRAQVAISRILIAPESEFHEAVWFKLNEPAFPEFADSVITRKKIDYIRQEYSDGSTIISDYARSGELFKVTYASKEEIVEVIYKAGKMVFIHPKKWGIADSVSMKYDYVWHGQIISFQNEKVREVWEYRYGKLQSMTLFENEKLKEKEVYMNCRKDYMRMVYFDNGKVLSSVRFVKGEVSGKANYYFREGEQLADLEFEKGRLQKGKIYKSPEDKEGTMVTKQDPDVMWYHCAPDGSFCCECHTRKGKVRCKPIKQNK